jgi:hypothetical protein
MIGLRRSKKSLNLENVYLKKEVIYFFINIYSIINIYYYSYIIYIYTFTHISDPPDLYKHHYPQENHQTF